MGVLPPEKPKEYAIGPQAAGTASRRGVAKERHELLCFFWRQGGPAILSLVVLGKTERDNSRNRVMDVDWNGWPFERVAILFASLGFLLVFVQVTLFHYRRNFRHWAQWVPVIALPVLAVTGLLLTAFNSSTVRTVFALLCWADVLGGLYGFYLHLRGVGQRVDGYRLQNFLVGPPVVLPLTISALSSLALLAVYWSGGL